MTRLALILALVAACSKDNPYYCDDACETMLDGGGSGSNACASNAECTQSASPVCDTTAGTCVACTASDIGACAGTTPVCVTAMNMCAACVAHDECSASNACLPSGACGTDTEVAYVASTGNDSNPCTQALPCATLTKAATMRPFVKLENDIVETVTLASVNVTVLAEPGTQISRLAGNDNAVVTVSGTSNVTLKNVVIRGGATSTGHGIVVGAGANGVTLTLEDVAVVNNNGLGLSIGGGMLTMTRVLVARNDSGGADVSGDFDITSSMFVSNGTSGSMIGGARLSPGATKHVFDFNTVADNSSTNATGRGVYCLYPMTATSTLVVNNLPNGCTFEYSMSDVALGGTTNKTGSAQFQNTLGSTPLAPDFYRIGDMSDAIDSGAPSSTVMTDIDGDSRPQGGARDIGADEYK
jgi:hypothetical protein